MTVEKPFYERWYNSLDKNVTSSLGTYTYKAANWVQETTGKAISAETAQALLPFIGGGASALAGYFLAKPFKSITKFIKRMPVIGGVLETVSDFILPAITGFIGYKAFQVVVPTSPGPRTPEGGTGATGDPSIKDDHTYVSPKDPNNEFTIPVPVSPAKPPLLPEEVQKFVQEQGLDQKSMKDLRAMRQKAIDEHADEADRNLQQFMYLVNKKYENTRVWAADAKKYNEEGRVKFRKAVEDIGLSSEDSGLMFVAAPDLPPRIYGDTDFRGNTENPLYKFAVAWQEKFGLDGGSLLDIQDDSRTAGEYGGLGAHNRGKLHITVGPNGEVKKFPDMSVTEQEEFLARITKYMALRNEWFLLNCRRSHMHPDGSRWKQKWEYWDRDGFASWDYTNYREFNEWSWRDREFKDRPEGKNGAVSLREENLFYEQHEGIYTPNTSQNHWEEWRFELDKHRNRLLDADKTVIKQFAEKAMPRQKRNLKILTTQGLAVVEQRLNDNETEAKLGKEILIVKDVLQPNGPTYKIYYDGKTGAIFSMQTKGPKGFSNDDPNSWTEGKDFVGLKLNLNTEIDEQGNLDPKGEFGTSLNAVVRKQQAIQTERLEQARAKIQTSQPDLLLLEDRPSNYADKAAKGETTLLVADVHDRDKPVYYKLLLNKEGAVYAIDRQLPWNTKSWDKDNVITTEIPKELQSRIDRKGNMGDDIQKILATVQDLKAIKRRSTSPSDRFQVVVIGNMKAGEHDKQIAAMANWPSSPNFILVKNQNLVFNGQILLHGTTSADGKSFTVTGYELKQNASADGATKATPPGEGFHKLDAAIELNLETRSNFDALFKQIEAQAKQLPNSTARLTPYKESYALSSPLVAMQNANLGELSPSSAALPPTLQPHKENPVSSMV